ncbi:hypothetical protein C4A76_21225 [Brevibacillus laterosporus]|nr:hypothetical protein C4A76_21225 [Brevibacillus laterosporus]
MSLQKPPRQAYLLYHINHHFASSFLKNFFVFQSLASDYVYYYSTIHFIKSILFEKIFLS